MSVCQQTINFSVAFDELKSLLQRQIALARQGSIGEVEVLCEKTSEFIDELKAAGFFESQEYKQHVDEFKRLYGQLRLVLNAERAQVGKELGKVRKSKKAVGAYRSNI